MQQEHSDNKKYTNSNDNNYYDACNSSDNALGATSVR